MNYNILRSTDVYRNKSCFALLKRHLDAIEVDHQVNPCFGPSTNFSFTFQGSWDHEGIALDRMSFFLQFPDLSKVPGKSPLY